jgi:hypothetical protein
VIVTCVPAAPELVLRLLMFGATVNGSPLLAAPDTVTTTFPVVAAAGTFTVTLVALQADAVPADTPLNVTVLLPWLAPNPVPLIVSAVPIAPELALKPLMAGTTVNGNPLLATLETVTTTLPVLAPAGTFTVMLVALQADAVPAEIPLKVTVLLPWLDPKLAPAMVIGAPMTPELGVRLLILGPVGDPPLAARNATICMIQGPAGDSGAVAP